MSDLFYIALLAPWLMFLITLIPVTMTLIEERRLDRQQQKHKPVLDA